MFQAEEKDSHKLEKDPVVCAYACKQGLGRVPGHTIRQINMQKKHRGPEEAMWELEDAMRWEHPFCSSFHSIDVVPI